MTQHPSVMRTTHSDRHGCSNKAIIPIWPPPRITRSSVKQGVQKVQKNKIYPIAEIKLNYINNNGCLILR